MRRVTELDMDGQGLNGTIPAQLGRLSGLRELRLAWGNQLTGSIPAELGRLTRLTFLNLAGNHLSGPIPPELGSIGPQLTHLVLSAPQPLPEGIGLTGPIPAQLGNLTGLENLYLDGNRLAGSIPPRLGRLVNLRWLYLPRNQLSGTIPTQLGALTNLTNLRLDDNRLSGLIPSQLSRLTNLRKVYLKRNAGFTGCVPPRLREVRFNDFATLNLPDCASDPPETPKTPLPAYALTELSWTITGGKPPHTLTINGQTVDPEADSHRVNCGPLTKDPLTEEPLPDQNKAFQALVTDKRGVSAGAEATVELVAPGAPTLTARTAASGSVALSWSAESTTGVTYWEYRQGPGDGEWGRWTRIAGSDGATTGHTVSGLTEDTRYSFHLRAVSGSVAGPRSATVRAVAGLTPTPTINDEDKLIYDYLHSAGGATQSGSYAFLIDPADLTSGATTFVQVSSATALLVNTNGYRDRDYTSNFAAIQVGDHFTWHAPTSCWYHFRVTTVLAAPPGSARKLFGIALETEDPCTYMADSVNHFNSRRDWRASLVWNSIPPDEPKIGPDGIRIIPYGYRVEGGHTYRLTILGQPTPFVIDVPVGMSLIDFGGFVPSDGPFMISYEDVVSDATLFMDPYDIESAVYFKFIDGVHEELPPDLVAKFEAILASHREAPLP